jgi:hypothetical protein
MRTAQTIGLAAALSVAACDDYNPSTSFGGDEAGGGTGDYGEDDLPEVGMISGIALCSTMATYSNYRFEWASTLHSNGNNLPAYDAFPLEVNHGPYGPYGFNTWGVQGLGTAMIVGALRISLGAAIVDSASDETWIWTVANGPGTFVAKSCGGGGPCGVGWVPVAKYGGATSPWRIVVAHLNPLNAASVEKWEMQPSAGTEVLGVTQEKREAQRYPQASISPQGPLDDWGDGMQSVESLDGLWKWMPFAGTCHFDLVAGLDESGG